MVGPDRGSPWKEPAPRARALRPPLNRGRAGAAPSSHGLGDVAAGRDTEADPRQAQSFECVSALAAAQREFPRPGVFGDREP